MRFGELAALGWADVLLSPPVCRVVPGFLFSCAGEGASSPDALCPGYSSSTFDFWRQALTK